MSFDFDVIVIGSGFGGSVMTCRLTQKGYKVCLLERGKRYPMNSFPRRVEEVKDKLFWDPKDKKYGYMELRDYPESDAMTVTASGLGGGSLIYANVLLRMPPEFFMGWPGGIDRSKLDPFYDKVQDCMEPSPYPFGKDPYYTDTPKTRAYMEVASSLPTPEGGLKKPEFTFPDLAVWFKGDFPGEQTKNKHGAIQSKCNKCGECDIGCNIHAKNTLDLNYLFVAENFQGGKGPAEIRTGAMVTNIQPLEEGYEVTYDNPEQGETVTIKAEKVVVSCGAVHTPELMLKMKKKGSLNNLSPMLGKKWCGNGDLLGFSFEGKGDFVPTMGPVITGAIVHRYEPYADGFPHGLWLEDAGFPVGLAWYLAGKGPSPKSFFNLIKLGTHYVKGFIEKIFKFGGEDDEVNIGDDMAKSLDSDDFIRRAFVLLGMGRDRNDGEIQLRHDGKGIVKWDIRRSELHFDRVRTQMKAVNKGLGGKFVDNPLTALEKIVAVHPLGGCVMGDSPSDSVVDLNGEVHGHPGLYIADGSIIPTSTGPNPSMTIAAMAEMIADKFKDAA